MWRHPHLGPQSFPYTVASVPAPPPSSLLPCHDALQDGQLVVFSEVVGMEQLNSHKPIRIKNCKARPGTCAHRCVCGVDVLVGVTHPGGFSMVGLLAAVLYSTYVPTPQLLCPACCRRSL